MTWSFTNISYPVELIYAQTVGFSPDVASMRCNPQAGALPATGTLSMTYEGTTITLPNCVVDTATIRLTDDGRFVMLMAEDRRALWRNVAPISGSYNQIRAGAYVPARQKTLRQLGTILMTALGEPTASVSALPTTVYPQVDWECESVVDAATKLFEQYGYSVTLGFDSETVTVVRLGTGATLSTTDRFVGSDTIDPKLVPRYVRNCFGRSVAQCRLLLEAVGRESSGEWLPIDSLSYVPADGWEATPPVSLSTLTGVATEAQYQQAVGYVRRAYRVKGFADDSWDVPDGSGSVSGLVDILPLQNRVLASEDIRSDDSYQPIRVYGRYYQSEDELGQPVVPGGSTTAINDLVAGREYRLDGENGLLIFEEPIYRISSGDYLQADLYLECTIGVRNQTNFSWNHYEYDVEVDAGGTGYHTVRHEQRAETIVTYNSSHVVTGATTNEADLETLGDAWAAVVLASYASTSSQYIAYHEPKLSLRCDGAILQIQHIITCGEHGHAVSRTTASRFFEFDKGIPSRTQRMAHLHAMEAGVAGAKQHRRMRRVEDADD